MLGISITVDIGQYEDATSCPGAEQEDEQEEDNCRRETEMAVQLCRSIRLLPMPQNHTDKSRPDEREVLRAVGPGASKMVERG